MMMCSTVEAALFEEPITVAVMDLGFHEGTSESTFDTLEIGKSAGEYVAMRLVENEHFTVIDKDVISEKLSEANINVTGLIDPKTARQLGAVSVALGHHKEDVLATLLLNMGYAGTIKTMPPLLRVDKGDLLLIRPLVRCHEHDLLRLAQLKGYPLLPQGLCGHGHAGARARVREVLAQWERDHPKLTDIMFRSLSHVVPSHLNDRDLYDFAALRATCSAREPALKPDASVLSPKEQQHTES